MAVKTATMEWYSGHYCSNSIYVPHGIHVIIEPQTPSNVTAVMPLNDIYPSYNTAGSLNITLEWDVELDTMHLGHDNQISNYTVTVFPEAANVESIYHTANTSIPLALHYDQDYNISVVASNCVGNSTPAQIHIRLGKSIKYKATCTCMHALRDLTGTLIYM